VDNLRTVWACVNVAQVASAQNVWLTTIRMVRGTKPGPLGVSVNLFGTHLLLSNGNLLFFLLTLRTSKRLLLGLFTHSVVQFTPNLISARLLVTTLISNLLSCLLRTYSLLKNWLVLYEQYFLVVVDEGTEHVVTFNTKTRSDPVDLLADYITITKRVPKFLRVDGAKEFVGAKMKAFCHLHNITLQIVTSYSHTMQARVEGAIGIINQHSRIALSTTNVPTRFWTYATTDFVYKHPIPFLRTGSQKRS